MGLEKCQKGVKPSIGMLAFLWMYHDGDVLLRSDFVFRFTCENLYNIRHSFRKTEDFNI